MTDSAHVDRISTNWVFIRVPSFLFKMSDLNILTINLNCGSDFKTGAPEKTKNLWSLFETEIPGMDVIFFQDAYNTYIFNDIAKINGKKKRYFYKLFSIVILYCDKHKQFYQFPRSDYQIIYAQEGSGTYTGIIINKNYIENYKELDKKKRVEIVDALYGKNNFVAEHNRAAIATATINGRTVLVKLLLCKPL